MNLNLDRKTKVLRRIYPRELARTLRNAMFDLRYGGWSGGYMRNPTAGASGTGATDYAIMPQIFDGRINPSDVLVDVGCGKGRVINWWLSRGLKNRIYGIEMLEDVAASVRRRLQKFQNVTIITGDATEQLPGDGTLFFLFNPFEDWLMDRFRERTLEIKPRGQFTIIYFAPEHLHVFQKDRRWKIEVIPLPLPESGFFYERHTKFAVITRL